ncbi:unnamed protein product [Ambrosiozyma monospora]|uniref:Unnamed protein product n=1 Tax=Ambrosiozyma monospora TaxID=43982 RepID=A0A9W6YU94_AMBMO|nr:unnamed protein product [Ambrosiozyma monospora]
MSSPAELLAQKHAQAVSEPASASSPVTDSKSAAPDFSAPALSAPAEPVSSFSATPVAAVIASTPIEEPISANSSTVVQEELTPPTSAEVEDDSSAPVASSAAAAIAAAQASAASGASVAAPSTKPAPKKKVVSINDEELFPALGSGASVAAPLSWGKAIKNSKSKPSSSSKLSSGSSFKPAVKSSSTQFTFIIDADQQVNLSKADIFKIFSKVKNEYGVSIESTFSNATNKRTFLLNGPIHSIHRAKREVVKRLTKPIKMEFGIPSKLRSTVIGAQGKTLKPILESTGVKIDISRPGDVSASATATPEGTPAPAATATERDLTEEEELFGELITVTLEGDIEGCEDAKRQILAIVNENTKTLSVRIPVEDKVKAFIDNELKSLTSLPEDIELTAPTANSKASNILLSGPRESVVDARNQIKSLLVHLDSQIVVENKSVPKPLHQFLDSDKILEHSNVVVVTPPQDLASTIVQFIGKKSDIPGAVAFGKSLAAVYITDSLELSRSHGGNVAHAKCITAFFEYSKFLEQLSEKYDVKINAPSYASLANDEIKTVTIQFVCHQDSKDTIKKVRKEIVETVNKITPNFVKVIDDIESFVIGNKLDKTVAIEQNVAIVPLGQLAGFSNKLILIVQQDDEDFLPSSEEISGKLEAVNKSLDPLRKLSEDVSSEVIELANDDQKHLEGNTLKLLLSKFDNGSIEIKLHQNKEGPSADEIYLIGYKSNINKAIKDIEQAIEDVKNYEIASKYNVQVEFPTSLLSRLIGQKGANLNQLRDEYDVKIDVLDDADVSKEGLTAVKLTGLKTNVDEAQKRLHQLSKKWLDEKTITLKIEQKFHRKMIGPSGVYVNRLQDKYNVTVRFPYENSKEQNKDEVIVRGPSKGVAKVEEELKDLLKYEMENGFKETISVPVKVLPQVIGRSGEHIKDISADTGVEINQQRGDSAVEKEKASGFAEFELIGSKAGIKAAKAKINGIVSRVENYTTVTVPVEIKWHKNLIGPSGMTKREIILGAGGSDLSGNEFRRLLQVPNKGSDSKDVVCSGDKHIVEKVVKRIQEIVHDLENVTTETLEIPKKKHRLLIGAGGSVRRGLEEEFKVRVSIPRVDVESDVVKVHGAPDKVELAKEKILKLTSA